MTKYQYFNHRLPETWNATYGYSSIVTTSEMNTTICYTASYLEKGVKST